MKRTLYGKNVVDATTDLTIEVTKADILAAKRCNKWSCALAEAIKRQLKTPFAEVANAVAYVQMGDDLVRYYLSQQIITAIKLFDKGDDFPPGTYDLKKVPKYIKNKRGAAHSKGAPKHGRPDKHRNQSAKRVHAGCGQLSVGHNKVHVDDKNGVYA